MRNCERVTRAIVTVFRYWRSMVSALVTYGCVFCYWRSQHTALITYIAVFSLLMQMGDCVSNARDSFSDTGAVWFLR